MENNFSFHLTLIRGIELLIHICSCLFFGFALHNHTYSNIDIEKLSTTTDRLTESTGEKIHVYLWPYQINCQSITPCDSWRLPINICYAWTGISIVQFHTIKSDCMRMCDCFFMWSHFWQLSFFTIYRFNSAWLATDTFVSVFKCAKILSAWKKKKKKKYPTFDFHKKAAVFADVIE